MGLEIEEFDYLESEKDSSTNKKEIKEEEKEVKQEVKQEKQIEEEKEYNKIFIVKVSNGKELNSLDMIADRVFSKNLEVYSIITPNGVKGYIFVEAKDKENVEEACFDLPYIKGILPKTISYEELKPMIEVQSSQVNIEKNDIVEIISEPFKKEKAKVLKVDKIKGEVVISLLNAVVPIPVTVKIDDVMVVRREE